MKRLFLAALVCGTGAVTFALAVLSTPGGLPATAASATPAPPAVYLSAPVPV